MIPKTYTPPTVHAALPLVADTLAWSEPERGSFVTLAAKLELAWVNDGPCTPRQAGPFVVEDRHHGGSLERSLEVAGELPPYLPHPELLLLGSAWVPGSHSTGSMAVQVSLARHDIVFRKHVEVHGPRARHGEVASPFRSMPLTWERALLGVDNPVGVDPRREPPNVIDPQNGERPAGFGPISPTWRERRQRLGAHAPPLGFEPQELPARFDGLYFQAAPSDQWLPELIGDEWIGLDGLHPVLPRILTQLPGLRVMARLMDADWRVMEELRLTPDRLVLDSNRQQATLFYRVVAPVELSQMGELTVLVGVADARGVLRWPNPDDPTTLCPHQPRRRAAESLIPAAAPAPEVVDELTEPEQHTMALRAHRSGTDVLPFHPDGNVTDPPTADDGDPLEGTMKLEPLKHLPKPLPFVSPKRREEAAATERPQLEAFVDDEVTAFEPLQRARPALPFEAPSEPPHDD